MPFRQVTVSGLPGIALRNPEMEVVVVPALGARITHLRRHDGREWLWHDPDIVPTVPAPGDDFASVGAIGGWHECFPTVAACADPAQPTAPPYPEQGELWSGPWDVQVLDHGQGMTLAAATRASRLPCEFVRDLTLDPIEPLLHLRYRLRHLGERPFRWTWAAHPAWAAPTGSTVSLPGVTQVRVGQVVGRTDLAPDDVLAWPPDGPRDPLQVLAGAGWALRVYADVPAGGVARLTDPRRGEQLEMAMEPGEVPQVAVSIDSRRPGTDGLEPVAVVGLEPCIGAPESLLEAVSAWDSAAILEPGDEHAWALTLRLPPRGG